MRVIFKTSYNQDIKLFKHNGYIFWYTLLIAGVISAPLFVDIFYIGELALIFIYAIAALSLMVLIGYTGLPSFGHAGFMAIGAFSQAYFINNGMPFLFAFLLCGAIGVIVGSLVAIPLRKMSGIYFAVATLAFAIIIENIFKQWKSFTGGIQGTPIRGIDLFGYEVVEEWQFYYICLATLIILIIFVLNLLRSHTGRAFIAIRDSEISSVCMGINVAKFKIISFGISGGIICLAGALFAHKISYITPEMFNFLLSIQILMMVVIGGLGSIHGAILGALFLGMLPQILAIAKDYLPATVGRTVGMLEFGTIGLLLIIFILFEPNGLYGRWKKIKLYLDMFPMYRKSTFKKQKTYLKTERLH
jgi:branched-chain amino acid transport system permease protein